MRAPVNTRAVIFLTLLAMGLAAWLEVITATVP